MRVKPDAVRALWAQRLRKVMLMAEWPIQSAAAVMRMPCPRALEAK